MRKNNKINKQRKIKSRSIVTKNKLLQQDKNKSLAIIYTFVPYIDTSGLVFAKRIQQEIKESMVIISNKHFNNAPTDENLIKLTEPYVKKNIVLDSKFTYRDWNLLEDFLDKAINSYKIECSNGEEYINLYSRSMSVITHLVAYKIKKINPKIKWIAEFSDPILMDVNGEEREVIVPNRWLKSNELEKNIYQFDGYNNLFFLSELLVYLFADEIIFTNELQRSFMLSYLTSKNLDLNDIFLTERIIAKSKIKPHPIMDENFYNIGKFNNELDKDCINIGYFGNLNLNRSFTNFFDAWLKLSNQDRSKLRLYVYTPMNNNKIEDILPNELKEYISINPSLKYFDFLASLKSFDYLLSIDTIVKDLFGINPFLPSKISDYLGAKYPKILALIEDGSPTDLINNPRIIKMNFNNINLTRILLK